MKSTGHISYYSEKRLVVNLKKNKKKKQNKVLVAMTKFLYKRITYLCSFSEKKDIYNLVLFYIKY